MNRRNLLKSAVAFVAAVAIKPIAGICTSLPSGVHWKTIETTDMASGKITLRHTATITDDFWKKYPKQCRGPELPSGFIRHQIELNVRTSRKGVEYITIKVTDIGPWKHAVEAAANKVRNHGFCELPFPVEPSPFPVGI